MSFYEYDPISGVGSQDNNWSNIGNNVVGFVANTTIWRHFQHSCRYYSPPAKMDLSFHPSSLRNCIKTKWSLFFGMPISVMWAIFPPSWRSFTISAVNAITIVWAIGNVISVVGQCNPIQVFWWLPWEESTIFDRLKAFDIVVDTEQQYRWLIMYNFEAILFPVKEDQPTARLKWLRIH